VTFRETRCLDIEKKCSALYSADFDGRLGMIPLLNSMELEQLTQLQKPVWDGHVISKSIRDQLWDKGLIDRWNGWQIVTIYGFAVLEVMGLIREKSA
jgi:hypothetical protein